MMCPRIPILIASTLLAGFVVGAARLHAQPAPPPQDYAAAIGLSPLKAPLTADFSPGPSFTIEAWVYPTAPSSGVEWIAGQCLASASANPFLGWALTINLNQRADFSYSTGVPGTYRSAVSSAPIPLQTWTHLAAVMDGTSTRIYVNGALAGSATALGPVPAPGAVPLSVGVGITADGRPNFQFFNGYARQVRFWSVARTAPQIAAAAGETVPADRTGLVAAWPLDEMPESRQLRDASGANRALSTAFLPLNAVRLGLLAAGPYFQLQRTPTSGGTLPYCDDPVLIDFDSDGDLDLVVIQVATSTNPGTPSRLRAFRNQQGTLVEATDAVFGDATTVHVSQGVVADFNGDGRSDLLLGTNGTDTTPFPGEQSRLFIQSADGRLRDETAARLPRRTFFTHDITAADIDGDGDLDIYLNNLRSTTEPNGGPRFYVNTGAGHFTEAVDRLPGDVADLGVAFFCGLLFDVDGDSYPDLVLGGGAGTPNEILMNDRTGRFRRDSRFVLPPKIIGPSAVTVALAAGDFNRDGRVDLVLSTSGGTSVAPAGFTIFGYAEPGVQLLLNRGSGQFVDASSTLGITWLPSTRWVKRLRPIDLNSDGHLDLAVQINSARWDFLLWLNRGNGSFLDVTDTYRPGSPLTLIHAADLDRDGRVDLISVDQDGVNVGRNLKNMEFGRLANLSVRTQAGTGDATLITGFALTGTGTKPLLVRATGPSLGAFGLTGTLADPIVEIAPLGGAKLTENNDWGGTPVLKNAFASVGAFPLSPDTSKDAALVFSPGPGAYAAKVTGANNGTGVALVEVYDAGTGNSPKLSNLSARTLVGTGADALFAGFVVNGTLPKKLLIRAAGPTLAAFGVGGTLADPVLTLRPLGSETVVATNDDWAGTAALKAAFAGVGAFPFAGDASRDAAVVIELPPGAYTATVSGKNDTTGVALVEVYELP